MSTKKAQPTSATPTVPTADEKIAALEAEIAALKKQQQPNAQPAEPVDDDSDDTDEPRIPAGQVAEFMASENARAYKKNAAEQAAEPPAKREKRKSRAMHPGEYLALKILKHLIQCAYIYPEIAPSGCVVFDEMGFEIQYIGKMIKKAVMTNQLFDLELKRDRSEKSSHEKGMDRLAASFREAIHQEPPIDPLPRLWAAIGAYEGAGLDKATATTHKSFGVNESEYSFESVITVQYWLKMQFDRLTAEQQEIAKAAYLDAHYAEYTRHGIGKFANEGQNTQQAGQS